MGHALHDLQAGRLGGPVDEELPEPVQSSRATWRVGPLERREEGGVSREEVSAEPRFPVDQQLPEPGGVRQHLVSALGEAGLANEHRHPDPQRQRQQREEDRRDEEGAGHQTAELSRALRGQDRVAAGSPQRGA